MYLQWLLLFCFFVDETLTENFTEVIEPIKNETNKISLIDRTYCNYENKETSVYEFPWLVAIKAVGWTLCSGSLINTRYVLRTAHCGIAGTDLTGFSVLIGDFNLKSNHTNCKNLTGSMNECLNLEQYGIEETIQHPLYNVSTYADYNVGLLRLNRTVAYKEYIRPICLPEFQTTTPKPGETLYLSGWLVRYDEELGRMKIKKKMPTTSITRAECREKIERCNLTDSDFYTLYDNNECIVEPEFDDDILDLILADFSDMGGAVMSFNNNQWKMEGILLTYRQVCIDEPLIYTRISTYLDWIEENMRPWN